MPDAETGKVEDHQGGGNDELVEREHAARDRLPDRKNPLESGPIGRGERQWDLSRRPEASLFTNESGQLVALDAATGKMLWHVNPGGNLSGAPMTYALGGSQFVLTPVGGSLYAWALPQ